MAALLTSIDELIPMVLPIGSMNIDATHIRLLHSILSIGKFNHAMEIGSFDGASAVAFVAAMNDGTLGKVTFCDPCFQPRFYEIVGRCSRQNDITLRYSMSNTAISDQYDCIFVDGDHRLEVVSEEARLILLNNIATVIAHDTNATNAGFQLCEGAAHLMQCLGDNGYGVLQDCIDRPNERTDRGLMFATKDRTLFDLVKPLFEQIK